MSTAPKIPKPAPKKAAAKLAVKPVAKPATKSVAKPDTKPVSKPRAAAPAQPSAKALPFLRFCHSEALRSKTLAVLTALEESPDASQHRDALAKLVAELNNAGMDYFYIQPLKQAKPGFIVEQSASLGMAGALQVIGSVVRNIIGRMDTPQLLSVSASIRQFMH